MASVLDAQDAQEHLLWEQESFKAWESLLESSFMQFFKVY